MNKPVYLGLSVLDISKIAMYEYWNDYANTKYGDNAKLLHGYIAWWLVTCTWKPKNPSLSQPVSNVQR